MSESCAQRISKTAQLCMIVFPNSKLRAFTPPKSMLAFLLACCFSGQACKLQSRPTKVTPDDIGSFLGGSRPVYLRMYSAGCQRALESDRGWKMAAEMYPQMEFLEMDCLKHDTASLDLCRQYQEKACGSYSPSATHIIFMPGEKEPSSSSCARGGGSDGDPGDYVWQLSHAMQIGHVGFLKMLGPELTDEFIASKEYTFMVLHNSDCAEDSSFLGKWVDAVSQDSAPVPFATSDVAFGRLDCSKFQSECDRWTDIIPSVVVHRKISDGSFAKLIKTSSNDVAAVIESAKSELKDLTTGTPLPNAPSPTTPTPDTPENDAEYEVLRNEALENRSVESIMELYRSFNSTFAGSSWIGEMTNLNNCVLGESNTDDRKQAIVNVNVVRSMAGIDGVTLNDERYMAGCQRTALVLHKLGYLTTEPNVERTDICVNGEKSTVTEYAKNGVLIQNVESISSSIADCLNEEDEASWSSVGRRRWLLNPNLKEIGFGFVPRLDYPTNEQDVVEGRIGVAVIYSEPPFDEDYSSQVNFVSWPSAGPFPADLLPPVWHVSSRVFRNASVSKSVIKVAVTRDDGKSIPVKAYFLNREYLGTPDALLLQMDDLYKELCAPGRKVHVEIWVTNEKIKLDYWFTVFDLKSEVKLCLYNANENVCSDYETGYKFGSESYGQISSVITSSQSERASLFVAEEITGSLDFSNPVEYFLTGAPISGSISVGNQARVHVEDASLTTVTVNWDISSNAAGQLLTGGKAKELLIQPSTIPEAWSKEYRGVDVYKGQAIVPKFVGDEIQENSNGYVFFGSYISGTVVGVSLSSMKSVLVLRTGTCEGLGGEAEDRDTHEIWDLQLEGLGKYLDKRKTVRWYICDKDWDGLINKSIFPDDRYQDYEIIVSCTPTVQQRLITFTYDPSMEKTIRTITFEDHSSKPAGNLFRIVTADNTHIVRHTGISIKYSVTIINRDSAVWIPNIKEDDTGSYDQELASNDTDSVECYIYGGETDKQCEFDISQEPAAVEWFRFKTSGTSVTTTLRNADTPVLPNQFLPSPGTEGTPITLTANVYDGVEKKLLPFIQDDVMNGPIVIENYQDITLKANWDALSGITYVNVGKVTLNLQGKRTYPEILVDEPGAWSSYLSSVDGMTIESLKVTSDSDVQADNAEVTNLQTSSSSCKLSGLTVTTQWDLLDSIVTIADAKVQGTLKAKRTDRYPLIIVEGNTDFSPTKIEYDMGYEESGANLLELTTETTTLVSGISSEQCNSIKDHVSLINAPYFKAICSDDGSLQISRTFDDGKNQDTGKAPGPYPPTPLPPPVNIVGDVVWPSIDAVPAQIVINNNASLSVQGGLEYTVFTVEIASSANVVATNMIVADKLKLTGASRISAAKNSRIMIVDSQTKVEFTVVDGEVPCADFGEVGFQSPQPAMFLIELASKVEDSHVIAKGRTLDCLKWLRMINVSGPYKDTVSFKCEKTDGSQSSILSDLLDEWAVIMEENEEDEDDGSPMSPGLITGILITLLVAVGLGVAISVYCVRKRRTANRIRIESRRISSSRDPTEI